MFKFITEENLKDKYRKNPFENYILKENEKLTPGGKEFLQDKNIKILSFGEEISKEKKEEKRESVLDKKLIIKSKIAMILFFKFGNKYINDDIKFGKKIIIFGKLLENLKKYFEGRILNLEIDSNLKKENYKKINGEIDEIYIYQGENSKILDLYYLSSIVEELKYLIEERLCGKEDEIKILENYLDILLELLDEVIGETIGGKNIGE